MICPECNWSFDGNTGGCPRCAVKGVVKSSTILISSGDTRSVYRSVEEVPDPLRSRLLRSTNGLNSATIVIADRQGRKEIAKAIRSLPGASQPAPAPARTSKLSPVALRSAAVFLLIAVAALMWITFR
jgi:hypothetical protein